MFFDQQDFDIRCEWGEHGVAVLAPSSDAVIIVDVLSFTTSVEIAVCNGALVFPYRWNDERAIRFAASVNAELAGSRQSTSRYSLSPASFLTIPSSARIVLPSPNGATLTLAARPTPVFAGCLRNAEAVAVAARQYGPKLAVIAAGERWPDDQSLRPAFEDFVGAGAIISFLSGRPSPEAVGAAAAFREVKSRLGEYLRQCSSGKELIGIGFEQDVELAAEFNISNCAPILSGEAYVRNVR